MRMAETRNQGLSIPSFFFFFLFHSLRFHVGKIGFKPLRASVKGFWFQVGIPGLILGRSEALPPWRFPKGAMYQFC